MFEAGKIKTFAMEYSDSLRWAIQPLSYLPCNEGNHGDEITDTDSREASSVSSGSRHSFTIGNL